MTVPEAPAWVLARDRLHQRLAAGVQGPLTLITAGAGCGKTVLLSAWLHSGGPDLPTAWLALDARHASRTRFWSDALAALRATGAVGDGELAELAAPQADASSEDFAARVVVALSEVARPLVLVIDDLHELTSGEALAELGYVITHAGRRLRVVAASRRDPDLSLHRLRLDGELTEIRMGELAFSPAEAAELFAALGQPLTPELADRLWQRTEGWAAGLRIAALSARGEQDMATFVETFAGDDRALADYLIAEVLARQPQRLRDFLLRTSIVDRIGPDLADALTGGNDGARLLAELERANAFISRVPGAGQPYRYHQLVTELLRGELRREAPEEIPALHRRASQWYAETGSWLPAIEHAVLAHDWQQAAALLNDHWMTLYLQGAGEVVHELLDRIPREHLAADPQLAVTAAAAWLMAGDAPAAEPYLSMAEETGTELSDSDRRRFDVSLAVTRLLHARLTGQLQRATEEARAVLRTQGGRPWEHDLASDDKEAVALLNIGIAELWAGGRHASDLSLRRSLHIASRRGHDYIELQALAALSAVAIMDGRLADSRKLAEQAIDLAERRGWSGSPAVATALFAFAGLEYQRDRLDEVARLLDRGEIAVRRTREPVLLLTLQYLRGLLSVARAEPEAAIACFREARSSIPEIHDEHFLALPSVWMEAHQLIDLERDDEARALLASVSDADPVEIRAPTARLLHRAGDSDAALEQLAPALDVTAPYNHMQILLDAHVVAATIYDEVGDVGGSMRCLEAALEFAEPEGYMRSFLDRGGPGLGDLLRRQVRHGTAHRALIDEILDRVEGTGGGGGRPAALADPLTARELDVLRYLPTSLQLAEISAELFLSVNTVRSHVKSIYRKLDVQRRSQAVERARELRLLGPSARGG
jgi:LuxR family transcriptional regulator, maltose regulon positive regulatory protein